MKTAVALVPAIVIGTLAGEYVEARLFNHIVVAVALVAGGAVLVAVDRRGNGGSRIRSVGGIGGPNTICRRRQRRPGCHRREAEVGRKARTQPGGGAGLNPA